MTPRPRDLEIINPPAQITTILDLERDKIYSDQEVWIIYSTEAIQQQALLRGSNNGKRKEDDRKEKDNGSKKSKDRSRKDPAPGNQAHAGKGHDKGETQDH